MTTRSPFSRRACLGAALTVACAEGARAQDAVPGERLPARTLRRPQQAPQSQEVVPFFDAHVHLNDEAMQLDLMERHGATRAIIFWGRASDNDSVAAAARRRPDRFLAFACVSPERQEFRLAWDRQDPALLTGLDRMLGSGRFRGIGEISAVHFPSPGFPEADYDPTSPNMRGIVELARRYRVPVMLHVEITRLREMQALLAEYPDVPIIWAHGGYTPLFLARRMLEQHGNLIYELSARSWPRHPRSPDYTLLRDGAAVWPEWLQLIEAKPDRFIIGTDASHRSMASDTMKYASVQAFLRQLSPAVRDKVAQTNLLALLAPARP
ncbi:amidohydrolase family protein [Roseomonas frigidaquae]|uniref:Amidohydrolase family protein n=1 Tax=Falsiroseomonas frigidaquae TaxID=487318 RepID=A0ABX1F7H6_9PROT|nr:amidohydrolase family protein [Falsiroseomonas frigidaquae]NKE48343.1 amidohydrolase family protein [Falsiroseomonas frigidaquae]